MRMLWTFLNAKFYNNRGMITVWFVTHHVIRECHYLGGATSVPNRTQFFCSCIHSHQKATMLQVGVPPHPLQRQILDPPPILVSDIRNHDPPAITVYFNISGQMGWGNITFHKADCSTCCNNSLLLWMRWVKRLSRLCPEKKHLSLNWPSLENPQVYRYSYHHVVFYCWAQVY